MSKKILIVDDHPDIVKMLVRKLRKIGWEYETAENGEIGVQKALELQPDLILMDMQMPVMDGREAVRRLRKKGFTGKISALTASVLNQELEQLIKDGFDYYITKPIDKSFISQLKEILGTD